MARMAEILADASRRKQGVIRLPKSMVIETNGFASKAIEKLWSYVLVVCDVPKDWRGREIGHMGLTGWFK